MIHTQNRSLRATTAIAALLVLGSTPALAQGAQPPLEVPPVQTPPADTPPVAPVADQPATAPVAAPDVAAPIPSPLAPTTLSDPMVQPAPAAPVQAVAQRPITPTTTRTHAAQTVGPRTSTARAVPITPQPLAPIAATPVVPMALAIPSAASKPAAAQSPATAPSNDAAWTLAGLLGIGVIGGAGVLAMRRRRSVVADDVWEEEAVVDPEPTSPKAQPAGSRFRMPAGPVPTGAAREALIARMAEAEPDEANPFTSLKARRRRARMILNAREIALRDKATAPFDWRRYEPFSATEPATPAKRQVKIDM